MILLQDKRLLRFMMMRRFRGWWICKKQNATVKKNDQQN
jgi:hypothetical protein